MATPAPFVIQPDLTAIALEYKNRNFIADDVLPRVPVAKQTFKYYKFTQAEPFTIPETFVGRRSPPNQVERTATEVAGATLDYALDDSVPNEDIENAPPYFNPIGKATEFISGLIALDREVRASAAVFATGNYAAGNQSTLSGTSQWSDFTNSNPMTAILNAMDSCIVRPNIGVFGRATWTQLIQHPKVVQAIYKSAQGAGIANRQAIADLLELSAVYVGESFYNTAKKGQTATFARVWGKHAAFLVQPGAAGAGTDLTFGFTAQFGSRIAGSFEDRDVGMRGGQRVRVGESVAEVLCANDAGYFFQNAVA